MHSLLNVIPPYIVILVQTRAIASFGTLLSLGRRSHNAPSDASILSADDRIVADTRQENEGNRRTSDAGVQGLEIMEEGGEGEEGEGEEGERGGVEREGGRARSQHRRS